MSNSQEHPAMTDSDRKLPVLLPIAAIAAILGLAQNQLFQDQMSLAWVLPGCLFLIGVTAELVGHELRAVSERSRLHDQPAGRGLGGWIVCASLLAVWLLVALVALGAAIVPHASGTLRAVLGLLVGTGLVTAVIIKLALIKLQPSRTSLGETDHSQRLAHGAS
jgi:hypothetical protein